MAERGGLDVVIQIVHDKQVEPPVILVVDPASGYSPGLSASRNPPTDACLLCHIGERAISVVVKELIGIYTRNIEIDESIIVVVSRRHAHRVSNPLEASTLRHIGECTIAVVAKEAIVIICVGLLQRWNGGAVGEEYVQQSIVVVIEQRNSAHHGLNGISLRADAVSKRKLDLRCFNRVFKFDPRSRRRR